MDQASQLGTIFIDGSGVWTNICYFHCRFNELDKSGFYLELADIYTYTHSVLDTKSHLLLDFFTGLSYVIISLYLQIRLIY